MLNWSTWRRDFLLIGLVLALFYGAFLSARPITVPDEARYTEIPREMVVNHDYLTPKLNYLKYFEKPPLFYWLQTVPIKTFGVTPWSIRLVNALMGILGCLITYAGARLLFNRRIGLYACGIQGSAALYFVMTQIVTIDTTLSTLLNLTLMSFLVGATKAKPNHRRYYMWLMYIGAALTVLTKGLIGIIFPGMIIFTWLLITKQWRAIKTYCLPSGIILLIAIAAPWHILMQLKHPEFFNFYIIKQQLLRFLTDSQDRNQPLWYLPTVAIVGLFPWTGFVLTAIYQKTLQIFTQPTKHPIDHFLLIWPVLIYLFFSFSHSQLPPYLLPIIPPLAILTATLFNTDRNLKLGYYLAILLALGLAGFSVYTYQYDVTKIDQPAYYFLFVVAACVITISTLSAVVLYYRQRINASIIALIIGVAGFGISSLFISNAVDQRPIDDFKIILTTKLKPSDQVISYNGYYQDLPIYAKRRVIVVNNANELELEINQDNLKGWFINDQQLKQRWQHSQRYFMVISQQDLPHIKQLLNDQLHIISQNSQCYLISNQRMP